MHTTLYYYSGTGNSLWAARRLRQLLGDQAEAVAMKRMTGNAIQCESDRIGLVFPVHIWGVPRPVVDFVSRLAAETGKYYFAIAVNAGQVARTLIQLKGLLKQKGLILQAGFDLVMPSNYIPWGGPGPVEKQKLRFADADKKLASIKEIIDEKQRQSIEKGPLWQNILFSLLNKMSYRQVPLMDKKFWSDERCTSCGLCGQICPAVNIELVDGRPIWKHHCEQCLACIQWCPAEAVQYGKKTAQYPRYHHPEIIAADLLNR